MKWSIVGLIAAGLVAALAAALLVGLTGAGGRGRARGAGDITVLVASKDMPAMTVVDSESVEAKTLPANQAPEDCLSDSVQVVNRVLVMPVKKGQAFTAACFARKGSGVSAAAAIPEGMRAFGVSLSDYASLKGLLYPGSVVDVLATFRLPGNDEVISMTLERGVQVWAVEEQTVLTAENGEPTDGTGRSTKRLVQLLVTPKQAEELSIARDYGKISLALRNPLEVPVQEEGETATLRSELVSALQRRAAMPRVAPTTPSDGGPRPTRTERWSILFIRGGSSEVQSVSMPVEKKGD